MSRIYNVTLIMIVETLHLLTLYQLHILSLLSSTLLLVSFTLLHLSSDHKNGHYIIPQMADRYAP